MEPGLRESDFGLGAGEEQREFSVSRALDRGEAEL